MLPTIIAQAWGGYSLIHMAITAVILICVWAVVYVVVQATGIPIPSWVMKIVGILIIGVVAVLAIRFLAGL